MRGITVHARVLFLALVALLFASTAAVPTQAAPRDRDRDKAEPADREERPYLYFTPKGLTQFRAKLRSEPFATRWSRLIQIANSYAGRALSNDRVVGGSRARPAQGLISILSLAYVVTEEARYGERAKQEAFALLEQSAWHENRGWNRGADLECAECSQACALFYDWCYDTMTDDERDRFKERALELGLKPYLASIEEHRPNRVDLWVDNPVTNWCGVCHGGCGLLGLALYDDLAEAKKAADYAWTYLGDFLDHVILQDGAGHEGVMYWRYGVGMGFGFVTAWEHAMAEALPVDTAERMAGYWDVYMWGTDRTYANFNDMGENTFKGLWGDDYRQWEGGPSGALNALFEARAAAGDGDGDPLLLWAADNGGGGAFTDGVSPWWFLWRRATPPARSMPKLQEAALFRGAGHALYRYDKLWLAFNGGWISDKSHHNYDLGSFVLVHDGERLVHDPGYGDTATGMHSTIVIDGENQADAGQAKIIGFAGGKKYHWTVCDLSQPWEARARRVLRSVIVVEGKYVVIVDDVETTGTTDIEWRVQTRHNITVDQDEEAPSATITGQRNVLYVVPALPERAVVDQGNAAINYVSIRQARPSPKAQFITVLFPGPTGTRVPRVEWNSRKDTLEVAGDKLEFKTSGGLLLLAKVNSEKVDKPEAPEDRVIEPAE